MRHLLIHGAEASVSPYGGPRNMHYESRGTLLKAVVMAGGEGSRLRPLTVGRPKPLVPIVNRPVMGHIMDLLRSHGFEQVVVTLRYMASAIQDYFDDGSNYGLRIEYCIEESPLGTAGSVRNAGDLLDTGEPFVVISGDALTDFDLSHIVAAHKQSGAKATIALARVPNPAEYGIVVTNDQGWVERLLEKPGWSDVVTDTVNTGIYVLEPEILDLIPGDLSFDFSSDLFPALLKAGVPIYGCIADGYWCDVGTIEEYMRATADVLYGRLKLPAPIGTNIGGGVWVGKDVEIAPNAQLFGPIYLGNEVKIKDGVRIYGPSVVRDYSVVDNHTHIERSIMWRNNYIGEGCEVRGAIIVRECSLKPKVMVFEGAVIGDNCVIGEGSIIHADVKLWPRKEIEPGTVVKDSIIWGTQGRRALFGRFGISGVVNVELTPEFAAKLGAAIGATLPKGSYVAINRDEHRSSRMLKRALISGLPGTGVNVWDLGSVPIPVLRYFIRSSPETTAGLHVRLSPFDQRVVDIRLLNSEGLIPNTAYERNIERNFFREDFRRAYLDDIGSITYAHQPVEAYQEAFFRHVDVEAVRAANFRLVVDFSNGSASDTLSRIFNKLGVDVVALNSRTDESKLAMLQDEFRANQQRLGKIVSAVEATLGVQLDVGGEKIFLLDEKGAIVDDTTAAALMTEVALFANPGASVAVPVTMPEGFERIAEWHGGRIVRIGQQMQNMAQAAKEPGVILVCDGTGNFVVPDFMPAIDGLMTTVRLLQYLAVRALRVSEIVKYLPPMYVARGSIFSPWDAKAAVMRGIHDLYKNHRIESLDGFKVYLSEETWVHISPHIERPSIELVAEGATMRRAAETIEQVKTQIERLVKAQTP